MIPEFPVFKKIEITDKQEIENFTKDFPPYSDFNFVALFCWDVDNKREVSWLNGNLVVKSTCDVTGKSFLSFLGVNNVFDTIDMLLDFTKKNKLKRSLRMIAQETVDELKSRNGLDIVYDRDSFDYIYQTNDLSHCIGTKYADVRNLQNRFVKKYPNYSVREFNLNEDSYLNSIKKIWGEWDSVREEHSDRESHAIKKLLDNANNFKLINIIVYIGESPVAFTVNEIIDETFAISHFAKVNYDFEGAFPFIWKETAKKIREMGCEMMNLEEDLGLPGIRKAKEIYRPVSFLVKYSIMKKSKFRSLISNVLK